MLRNIRALLGNLEMKWKLIIVFLFTGILPLIILAGIAWLKSTNGFNYLVTQQF